MAGAVEITGDTYSAEAAADLSGKQFYFVKLDGDGKVAAIAAITDVALGILQNKPTSGKTAQVKVNGGSKLVADGVIQAGGEVMASADSGEEGHGKAAATTNSTVRAIALEDSVDNAIFSVFLCGPYKVL